MFHNLTMYSPSLRGVGKASIIIPIYQIRSLIFIKEIEGFYEDHKTT